MSWIFKSSISTVILSCRNSLVPYYFSKVFVIVETELGGVENIPIIVKNQTNATHLHEEESIITYKASIPATVNTLKKNFIARDIYEKYVSNYYDDRNVESYNLDFFQSCLDEMEHPALITEWTINMEEDAYKKQAKEKNKPS